MKKTSIKIILLITAIMMLCSCSTISETNININDTSTTLSAAQSINDISEYSNKPYEIINNNIPEFEITDYSKSFEKYGELDELGRCTACIANVGKDIMPTEERGTIGAVKPTGWQTVKYDNVDGKYLYNRCHLIGYQLTAENANVQNLITGTRYLNVEGMLPFENKIADYVKNTENHVLYRVTPDFKDNELVARGVHMEAYSIEDEGKGVQFNIYCYNVQPEIEINYATGESKYIGTQAISSANTGEKQNYIVNVSTKKFHKPTCSGLNKTKEHNKKKYYGNRESLIKNGYSPCGQCNP